MQREDIARVAHEVNRAYCLALGDLSQPAWEDAPEWQKKSARAGVDLHLDNPDATAATSHESWLAEKERDGWVYGPTKDPRTKHHPCMVPFDELPVEQAAKDYIFRAVVHSLAPHVGGPVVTFTASDGANPIDVPASEDCISGIRMREPHGTRPRGLYCEHCGAQSAGEPLACKRA